MKISFRQIRRNDFRDVRDLALRGWCFAYKHLKTGDIKRLVEEYYSDKVLEDFLNGTKSGKRLFVLAFDNDKLAGFCNIAIKDKAGGLSALYIEPRLIGRGLGKRLLKLGEDYLKSQGIGRYFTLVNKHNETGINFYLRNGFERSPGKDRDDEFEAKALMYMEKHITF